MLYLFQKELEQHASKVRGIESRNPLVPVVFDLEKVRMTLDCQCSWNHWESISLVQGVGIDTLDRLDIVSTSKKLHEICSLENSCKTNADPNRINLLLWSNYQAPNHHFSTRRWFVLAVEIDKSPIPLESPVGGVIIGFLISASYSQCAQGQL